MKDLIKEFTPLVVGSLNFMGIIVFLTFTSYDVRRRDYGAAIFEFGMFLLFLVLLAITVFKHI